MYKTRLWLKDEAGRYSPVIDEIDPVVAKHIYFLQAHKYMQSHPEVEAEVIAAYRHKTNWTRNYPLNYLVAYLNQRQSLNEVEFKKVELEEKRRNKLFEEMCEESRKKPLVYVLN
jgi:methylase of polypeptide subunit release factors